MENTRREEVYYDLQKLNYSNLIENLTVEVDLHIVELTQYILECH
jgi:hypothetical protein